MTCGIISRLYIKRFEKVVADTTINHTPIADSENTDEIGDFCFIINDSVIYYSINDFRQPRAKGKYYEWKKADQQYLSEQQQLKQLRQQYATADEVTQKELTPVILRLENNQSQLLQRCQTLLLEIRQEENQH